MISKNLYNCTLAAIAFFNNTPEGKETLTFTVPKITDYIRLEFHFNRLLRLEMFPFTKDNLKKIKIVCKENKTTYGFK